MPENAVPSSWMRMSDLSTERNANMTNRPHYARISEDAHELVPERTKPTPSKAHWFQRLNRQAHDGVSHSWTFFRPPTWISEYRRNSLRGDIIASLSVASLYIPLSFSFSMLAGVDPMCGLYAFVFHPLIYALLGSCPLMIVGPEATGSLLVGSIIRHLNSNIADEHRFSNAEISGVATAIAGALLLTAGVGRLGFLDNLLSRPLMQGFICGVGFVLIVGQAISELGLQNLAVETGVANRSAIVKLGFLFTHITRTHMLTAVIALPSLAFILCFRQLQLSFRGKFPWINLFPDRLVVVATTTLLTWALRLDKRGLIILGSVDASNRLPTPLWPLANLEIVKIVLNTSVLIALLGYFESSVTARSLRLEHDPQPPGHDNQKNTSPNPNRELFALGTANLIGGCFSTLPAFGGFGRSKLNVQTGGTTPMSNVILSFVTILCIAFVSPLLYYVPKPVLSSLATVVGISMMEEGPRNVRFFYKTRGWQELGLMGLIFFATAIWSMSLGVAIGLGLTFLKLLWQSTQVQVKTLDRHSNMSVAEAGDEESKAASHDLVMSISGPLTFANIGDLRARMMHVIDGGDATLVLDISQLTTVDACAIQILTELAEETDRQGRQIAFRGLTHEIREQFMRSGILNHAESFDTIDET